MSGEGFLSRWSRRKREELRGTEPETATDAAPAPPAAAAPTRPQALEAESKPALTDEELAALPPIESIDETTDIAGYLREGVPAALKNAALRRLWAATPGVRDYLDPARDYAWDWNVPGGVPGDGPLGAGFDAKALVDRLFAGPATKVVDDGHAFPDGENADDAVPQTAAADVSATEPDAKRVGDDADPAPGHSGTDAGESSAGLGFAGEEPASLPGHVARREPQTTEDRSEFRPRPRRHGGATPV